MHKRGLVLFFILLALIGFFIGRETNYTGRQISAVGNLTVQITTSVGCTLSDAATLIAFGSNLSTNVAHNATGNYFGLNNITLYNITNNAISTSAINVSIGGADFLSGSNRVGISNISWASNTTIGNGTNMFYTSINNLSTSYDATNLIAVQEPVGSTAWYRLWLRVPNGTAVGNYTGNYTIRCEET